MAWTITDGTQSIGTTEHDIISDTTYDAGDLLTSKQAVQLELVVSGIAVGDSFEIARRESINGTNQRKVLATIFDVQPDEPIMIPLMLNGNGWAYTLKKLTGTDRTWEWSVKRVPE